MRAAPRPILLTLLLGLGTTALPGATFAGDAAAGAAAWTKTHAQPDGSAPRSCVTCHGEDLTAPGRHAVTGKVIEPLAPSVNPRRLTDPDKVATWLLRNCRWTLGRACTPEEKANFISFIQSQ